MHYNVPPSTVSRAIKALETNLGVSLVERTTRQVRLTEMGAWYRAQVSGPIRALVAADEMAEKHSREPTGTVRITALPGYYQARLGPVFERFRAEHPKIICDLELTDSYLDLSSGEIDVALRATPEPPEYLVAKRLHSNRFLLVAAPSYLKAHGRPRVLADLREHAAIGYRGRRGVKPWLAVRDGNQVIKVERRLIFVTNDGYLILDAVIAGQGLAFLPDWGVADAIAAGEVEEVVLEDAELTVSTGRDMAMYLLFHPEKARLGKVRALVDFLVDGLRSE